MNTPRRTFPATGFDTSLALRTLLAACVLFFLPGLFSLPPVDRDEPRFAQATAQMVHNYDYFTIQTLDLSRNKKPPGIHWLQSIPESLAHALGVSAGAIWPYRIPSFMGAVAAVLLTFSLGRRLFNPYVGYLAALILAASTLMIVEAHLATTDAFMLAIIVGCFHQLLTIVQIERGQVTRPIARYAAFMLWILVAAGILIKGPIVPLIVVLTIVGLHFARQSSVYFRWPRVLAGLALSVTLALPVLISVNDGQFLRQALTGDLLPKLVGGDEGHGFPPMFYLVILPATFFPGSLLLLASWKSAWQHRTDPAIRFCAACIVPTWIVFEIIPTKLPHYVLPTYPALALLVAAALWRRSKAREDQHLNGAWWIGLIVWCAIAIGLPVFLTVLSMSIEGHFNLLIVICYIGAALVCVLAAGALLSGLTMRKFEAVVWSSILLVPVTISLVLPNLDHLWPSRAVARMIPRWDVVMSLPAGLEPSLGLMLWDQLMGGAGLPSRRIAVWRVVQVDSGSDEGIDFDKRYPNSSLTVTEVGGFNISKGRWLTLRLYRIEPEPVKRVQPGDQR